MIQLRYTRLLTIVLVLALCANAYCAEKDQDTPTCDGPYKGKILGKDFEEAELQRVLEMHREWYSALSKGEFENREALLSDPRRANLCGAVLKHADLSGAFLRGVNLMGAKLSEANLTDANLSEANLTNALLFRANLTAADLWGANLPGANLTQANLTGANLLGANLKYTNLVQTNLDGVIFDPLVETLPPVDMYAEARNLSGMTYGYSPHTLIKLRNLFRDAGWRQQGREITYAIKHTEISKVLQPGKSYPVPPNIEKLDAYFGLVFFELTTQWGMKPGRALIILLVLVPLFALPYIGALRTSGKDGIWQEWIDSRVRKDLGQNAPVRIRVGWLKAIGYGFYFSILSAFHIGWRDLNVGSWIASIQLREYRLRASGWARMVSGIQSLISVYLVAIWALTYFGRPFG